MFEPYQHELIPEWTERNKISFELKRPSGQIETLTRTLPVEIKPPLHFTKSIIDLPETDDSGFLCDSIDPKRYSDLYFQTYPNVTLKRINQGRDVALMNGDIDFSQIFADTVERKDETGILSENPERLKRYRSSTTFYAEYQAEDYSGYYCPKNVVVFMTLWTSSSGSVLHPLSYEKLKSFNFDIKSEFLYAMEFLLSSQPPLYSLSYAPDIVGKSCDEFRPDKILVTLFS